MHIHILGICGTFMGSLAQLAKAQGHRVTGSDQNVYPPMSDQLEAAGIALTQGYDPQQLEPAPDLVVIGNALSRGNPAVEAVLDRGLAYTSGAQLLEDVILPGRWVLAVAIELSCCVMSGSKGPIASGCKASGFRLGEK